MDEILIEEKKYISSKQAAKITGYAKDYIGQLCREGRVSARLVGRNWYVLETAIQDHRFGDSEIELEKTVKVAPQEEILPSTWETPRYEASSEEILPSINRLRAKSFESEPATDFQMEEDPEVTQPQEVQEQEPEPKQEEDTTVDVPIRSVLRTVPSELLPQHEPHDPKRVEKSVYNDEKRKREYRTLLTRTIQMSGILLAMVMVAISVAGSGYFDSYLLSNSQVRIIAGVALYNK